MQNLLKGLGYQPSIAASGKDAVAKYETLRPEAVLMDINMPEMNGVNCAEKILDADSGAKIAFITGYEVEGMDEFGDRIKNSVKTFLTKPVELADLSATLARLLQS